MKKSIIKALIEKENLEINSLDIAEEIGLKDCFSVNGVSQSTGNDLCYLIYDCSNKINDLDLEKLGELFDEQMGISKLVMVFKNWRHERNVYWESWNVKGAAKKKSVKVLFEKKVSIYTEGGGLVELFTENNGINYLEYIVNDKTPNNKLEGHIYNISFFELEKLFNVTGIDLFKKNVRNGKEKDKINGKLQKKFKGYLHVHIYNYLQNKLKLDNEQIIRLKEALEIDDNTIKYYVPENFWFFHNGITIYSFDDVEINRSGNKIILNSKKVGVINGAQTLTGLCLKLEDVQRNTNKAIEELRITNDVEIRKIVEEACKLLKMKMVLIQGKEELVSSITYGLNMQIPILEEDIIATSDEVVELNHYLEKGGIQITKAGEEARLDIGLSVLEFVKKYLISQCKPGESKNLNKTKLVQFINEALELFEEDNQRGEDLIDDLNMLNSLDDWWKTTKKKREIESKSRDEKTLNLYGKLYFGSYLVLENKIETSTDMFEIEYYKFIRLIFQIQDSLTLENFKNDTLFKKLKKEILNQRKNTTSTLDNIDLSKLKLRLNESKASRYANSRVVEDFLKESNISIDYYRVITMSDFKCKEAFPFPSSSFSELYLNKEEDSQSLLDSVYEEVNKYRKFNESKWYTELTKKYPVFVIERDNSHKKAEHNKILSVKLIKEFSFYDYLENAENVYEKTIQSFIDGNEFELPKISDNLEFHVRPKAINADDTFEFSNGEQITKRTFWANKNTVESIIRKGIEKKFDIH